MELFFYPVDEDFPVPILPGVKVIIGKITMLVFAASLQIKDRLEFYVDYELKHGSYFVLFRKNGIIESLSQSISQSFTKSHVNKLFRNHLKR